MIAPRFHTRLLVLLAAFVAGALLAHAQPPAVAAAPAEPKSSQPPRSKPQVIYHLPPASPYAAALHSQAKSQRDALPVDSNMPTSLQTSRAAANEAAAKSRPDSVAPQKRPSEREASRPAPKMHEIKRRSVGPGHSAGKGRGPGHSHGKKSHRK